MATPAQPELFPQMTPEPKPAPTPVPEHPMRKAHGRRPFRDLTKYKPFERRPAAAFAHRTMTVEIKLTVKETAAHALDFRTLAGELTTAMHRRVYEAVLTRAARRFLVAHRGAFLHAAAQYPQMGRELREEDWLTIMDSLYHDAAPTD